MAYDFSNIKTIVRNGTELSKITNSAGTVIWQKLYVWKRYNVITTKEPYESYVSGNTTFTVRSSISGNLYSSMSFNTSTGMYTLSNPSGTVVGGGLETPLDAFQLAYVLSNSGTSGGFVWCDQFYNEGYKYFADNYSSEDSIICMINSEPTYSNKWPITIYKTRGGTSSSSQGSYIDLVTSTNPNAYPTNGIYGSYWYVKQ